MDALKTKQGVQVDGHALQLSMSSSFAAQEGRGQSAKRSRRDGDLSNTKLLVKNVPFEANIKELRDLFSSFGRVKSCRIPSKFGGGHRGYVPCVPCQVVGLGANAFQVRVRRVLLSRRGAGSESVAGGDPFLRAPSRPRVGVQERIDRRAATESRRIGGGTRPETTANPQPRIKPAYNPSVPDEGSHGTSRNIPSVALEGRLRRVGPQK